MEQQKTNKHTRLLKLGFDEVVADLAIDIAFDKGKQEMYTELSREEHIFIGKLKRDIESRYGTLDDVHRRHDSILIFNRSEEMKDLFLLANNFEYRNTKGWLKMEVQDIIQPPETTTSANPHSIIPIVHK